MTGGGTPPRRGTGAPSGRYGTPIRICDSICSRRSCTIGNKAGIACTIFSKADTRAERRTTEIRELGHYRVLPQWRCNIAPVDLPDLLDETYVILSNPGHLDTAAAGGSTPAELFQ